MKKLVVLVVACLLSGPVQAQQAPPEKPQKLIEGIELGDHVLLTPHIQYRPRFTVAGKKDFNNDTRYTAFDHRARLGAAVTLMRWYKAFIQLQDVRRWGEETNTLGDYAADGFDLHQAWVEIGCPWGLFVRLGRQEIAHDNHRIIGTVGWAQQGRSFDAIRFGYRGKKLPLAVEMFYAMLGEKDAYAFRTDPSDPTKKITTRGAPEDAHLAGLWARYKGLKFVRPSLSLFYDYKGVTSQDRVTLGLFVDGKPLPGLSYSAEFYYQAGSFESAGKSQDIAAFMAAVRLGYTVPVAVKPSLTVWFEYLSGDDDRTDSTNKAFDTLFATNHKFYGFMDFFLNVPAHTGGAGLMDIGGRAKIKPFSKMVFFVDFHHFRQPAEDADGETTLGNELDVLARVKVTSFLSLEAVFGVFFPNKALKAKVKGRGDDTEMFGYLQTDLKF